MEQALRSNPRTSVRVITSFSSNEEGALGLAHNLRNTACGDWVWRIGETSSFSHGCEGSVWLSEILSRGQEVGGEGPKHDSRADVSLHTSGPLADGQVELLAQPHALFERESTHASLRAKFGEKWELGLMSHILPFVSTQIYMMIDADMCQADPQVYYPKAPKRARSITYFPSPFTPSDEHPRMPWTGGWSIFRREWSCRNYDLG